MIERGRHGVVIVLRGQHAGEAVLYDSEHKTKNKHWYPRCMFADETRTVKFRPGILRPATVDETAAFWKAVRGKKQA